jgi:hypothetical protein
MAGITNVSGETTAMISGAAAPAENVSAEASAASMGLAPVVCEMPSSSRACAASASLTMS